MVAMTTEHLNEKRERGLGSDKEYVEEEVGRAYEGRGRWEEGPRGGQAPLLDQEREDGPRQIHHRLECGPSF